MYLRSRAGETLHIDQWKQELDDFWGIFRHAKKTGFVAGSKTYPTRPKDAWERYVKIIGLEVV